MRGRSATRLRSATSSGILGLARHRVRERVRQPATTWNAERSTYESARRASRSRRNARAATRNTRDTSGCASDEPRGALLRRRTLVLVVEADADRVVRVVGLGHEVRDRELQLEGARPARLVARHELQARREVREDVRGLRDDEVAVLEERRREDRGRASRRRAIVFIIAFMPPGRARRRRTARRPLRARGGRTRRDPGSKASSRARREGGFTAERDAATAAGREALGEAARSLPVSPAWQPWSSSSPS